MAESPDSGTISLAWARSLIDGLVDGGVQTAVVAPGSRSTPLVLAAADHEDLRTVSLLDERAGGFFALGRGHVASAPTAVITTSGTATANVLPAVVEAHESRIPLVVLTGDRPPELHDSGANQTIRQDEIYGEFTRYHRTLGEPALDAHRLRSVRATATRAIAEAHGPPAGPVHLNVPVRKPLEPSTPADRDRASRLARGETPTVSKRSVRADDASVHAVATQLNTRQRRLLVVGPAMLDSRDAEALCSAAAALDMPVLADPASGLRFHQTDEAIVCGGHDGYLSAIETHVGHPDIVCRVGPQPTSKALRAYLDESDASQVQLDASPAWRDGDYRLDAVLQGAPGATASALADLVGAPGERAFRDAFERAESAYWQAVEETLADAYFEGVIANRVAATTPSDALLFAGNSMPIRDIDRFARPRPADIPVIANRGASGIDGTVSTALGAADASERPVVALLGDLATYHDMNGLLAVERVGLDATIVVVNNDGGGIFHKLPIEDHDPPFEELFATPHGMDFEAAARQYDLGYTAVHDRGGLERALRSPIEGGRLVECHVERARSQRRRESISETLAEAVATELA